MSRIPAPLLPGQTPGTPAPPGRHHGAPVAPGAPVSTALPVAVLSLAVFMSSLDLFIVNLAFPSISRQYAGTGLSALSWVLDGYTIVFAAVLVPAGRWADRLGRRRLLIAGISLFTLGSALCGAAPGVVALIAARTVQALGAGLMVPASLSLLLAVVPAAGRARAIGSWSAAGALGAALGPVIGGALVALSWRWVFWVNLPVGVLAVVLARRAVPESRDPASPARPDLLGAGLLALAVGLLALGLVELPSWPTSRIVGALAASGLTAAALLLRCRSHPAPVLELPLLASRAVSGASAASVLYYAGFGAFVLNSVEFLTGVWQYSPVRAGLAIAPGPLMVLPVARLLAPRLAGRLGGAGRVAAVGALVNAASQALWLVSLTSTRSYATSLLPAQLLGGIGVGLTIPSLIGAGSAGLAPSRFGTGSGILNMARQVGTVVGVAALVAALGAQPGLAGFRTGIMLIIGFFVAAAVVSALTLARARPVVAPPRRLPDTVAARA